MEQLATLWREHRLLLVAFIASLTVTILIAVRLSMTTMNGTQASDIPIQGQLTIGYFAQSFGVRKEELMAAAGVGTGKRRGFSLAGLARGLDVSAGSGS